MHSMEEYSTVLAAMLIDDELRWRLARLPRSSECSVIDKAIMREAARRGIDRMDMHPGDPVSSGHLAAVPAEPGHLYA